jgi:tRNA (guanine37-N1)-methyltransferase
MLCVKVPIKDAEKVKKELLKKGLFDKERTTEKSKGFVYFPVAKRFKSKYSLVEKHLKRKALQTDLKKSLIKKLGKKDLEFLRRSMDILGNIAILEIPKELEDKKKEKLIAEEVLKLNQNITTVLKKGKHEGVFRVQKLEHLAGKKTKEATYKEHNVIMKLNAEQVYFSPRLSTERKRIMQLVKKPEDILVMFSGCAPYVCVLAKNTPARYIWGIEINPVAHRYGWENLKLNKINNAFLINEDVKTALPHFYQKILGLKSAIIPEQLQTRVKENPAIMELHTFGSDFRESFENLKKTIRVLQKLGKYIVVHQPLEHGISTDLTNRSANSEPYNKMISLIKEFDVDLVIHPVNSNNKNEESHIVEASMIENIKTFSKYYDKTYFENNHIAVFSTKESIFKVIKETGMKNMCIDTCHMLYLYSNQETVEIIKEIQKYCNTYFHLNDYKDNIHSRKLSEDSHLDIKGILPLVTKGVTEVNSKDELKSEELLSSWHYIGNFQKTFDRILMPLPKTADEYLDVALAASHRGTVIHFYDFQKEGEFEKSIEKISKACGSAGKKFKVLNIAKCGQNAPREFRICVDFEIL